VSNGGLTCLDGGLTCLEGVRMAADGGVRVALGWKWSKSAGISLEAWEMHVRGGYRRSYLVTCYTLFFAGIRRKMNGKYESPVSYSGLRGKSYRMCQQNHPVRNPTKIQAIPSNFVIHGIREVIAALQG
jgi:hypothetical protein